MGISPNCARYLEWNGFENPNVAIAALKLFRDIPDKIAIKSQLADGMRQAISRFEPGKLNGFERVLEGFQTVVGTPEPETFGELRKITGLTIFTARHYLEKAESCGDLYQAGRSGIFPSEQAFLLWKQKREDARITRFLKTPEGVVSSYDRTRNVICTECRNSVTMQRVLSVYRART